MQVDSYYPEMEQTAKKGSDLIIETLYKKFSVTCLHNIKLKENRSVIFQYKSKKGNNVYYVTNAGIDKLKKVYNVAFSCLLD
jgi:hypothetical protein